MTPIMRKIVTDKNMFGYALARADEDFIFFTGKQSRFEILCLQFRRLPREVALALELSGQAVNDFPVPFALGLVALVSYDDYSVDECQNSQFFNVSESIVKDNETGVLYHFCEENLPATFEEDNFETNFEALLEKDATIINWQEDSSREDYLNSVSSIREQIKQGRFYQLNFLRYFHSNDKLSTFEWLRKLYHNAGPYGAMIKNNSETLISFSPEKFFSVKPDNSGLVLETHPIKGTSPRFDDKKSDEMSKEFLNKSEKDHAELHMIVDLMRNDFFRLCGSGNVDVQDPGTIHSFTNVHHLIASVIGRLKNRVNLGQCFEILCPGGSITGAPKVEVMKAIREMEGRSRGYFMGNIVLFDHSQQKLDSSILIRTVYQGREGQIEFAVGSGIVIGSDPESEFDELKAKMRVVTNNR